MKKPCLILLCSSVFMLAILLGGCVAPQQSGYNSHFNSPRPDGGSCSKDPSDDDGLWALLEYPIWIGAQFLGGH